MASVPPDLFPLPSPSSVCSRHSGLLADPPAHQARSHLLAYALTLPFDHDAFPRYPHSLYLIPDSAPAATFWARPFLTPSVTSHPPPTSPQSISLCHFIFLQNILHLLKNYATNLFFVHHHHYPNVSSSRTEFFSDLLFAVSLPPKTGLGPESVLSKYL